MKTRDNKTYEELIEADFFCDVAVGPGWERHISNFVDDLVQPGFLPTCVFSKEGVLHVYGEGKVTDSIKAAIMEKSMELSERCEFCWLGGMEKAISGRCQNHKDWEPYWEHRLPTMTKYPH